MIEKNKEYILLSGEPVKIYEIIKDQNEVFGTFYKSDRWWLAQWDIEGRFISGDLAYSLIEKPKWDHIKQNDEVIVWNEEYSERVNRHFLSIHNNKVKTYSNGLSRWTALNNSEFEIWDNCITRADYFSKK